jgi:hypothetical protein
MGRQESVSNHKEAMAIETVAIETVANETLTNPDRGTANQLQQAVISPTRKRSLAFGLDVTNTARCGRWQVPTDRPQAHHPRRSALAS